MNTRTHAVAVTLPEAGGALYQRPDGSWSTARAEADAITHIEALRIAKRLQALNPHTGARFNAERLT